MVNTASNSLIWSRWPAHLSSQLTCELYYLWILSQTSHQMERRRIHTIQFCCCELIYETWMFHCMLKDNQCLWTCEFTVKTHVQQLSFSNDIVLDREVWLSKTSEVTKHVTALLFHLYIYTIQYVCTLINAHASKNS